MNSSGPPARCPVCVGAQHRPFLSYDAAKYGALFDGRGPSVRFVACTGCGLVYQYPRLDGPVLRQIYAARLRPFMGAASPTATYLAYARQVAATDFAWLTSAWQAVAAESFPAAGRSLEIGCATGQFLLQLRERGWIVRGVEPEDHYSEYGRREYGLDIHTGFFEDAEVPNGQFDLVACLHVLEHVIDPLNFLRRARTLLTPAGYLYVVVPNLCQYDTAQRHPDLFDLLHLFAFSRNSLQAVLSHAGFGVVQVEERGRQLAMLARAAVPGSVPAGVDDPERLIRELRS